MTRTIRQTALESLLGRGVTIPPDALSGQVSDPVDFERAVETAGFGGIHAYLTGLEEAGAVVWEDFEIARVASVMPSMAYLDREVDADGTVDFRYRFVGEELNLIARRSLRGQRLGEVLVGDHRRQILDEYEAAIAGPALRASAGRVVISDMRWMHYLRLLYPVRVGGTVSRLLLFMLFSRPDATGR